jgi:uncharacterized cupin superfamily protein
MKIILDEEVKEKVLRADRAWDLFFESKHSLDGGPGLQRFANWFWDELGEKAGNLNRNSKGEVRLAIPSLEPDALEFLLRLASFWADEVYVKKGDSVSGNLWKKPVVNVFDDERLGAEKALKSEMDDAGSTELNLMPLLGPGRSFFSDQVIEKGESTARLHSHSALDEYYLVLEGKGTLRFNGKEIEVKRGDIVGKPAGPDAATQLIADRGEKLRILDMEVWHESAHFSKDVMLHPDFNEVVTRGPGWGAIIPQESLMSSEEYRDHYDEGYKRTKDGGWVPSKNRGHRKVREKGD